MRSDGSLQNKSWNGENPFKVSDTNVLIAHAAVVMNKGHICPLSHKCLAIISLMVLICLLHLLLPWLYGLINFNLQLIIVRIAWIIADVNSVTSSHIICLGGPNRYITLYTSASATVCACLSLSGTAIVKLV